MNIYVLCTFLISLFNESSNVSVLHYISSTEFQQKRHRNNWDVNTKPRWHPSQQWKCNFLHFPLCFLSYLMFQVNPHKALPLLHQTCAEILRPSAVYRRKSVQTVAVTDPRRSGSAKHVTHPSESTKNKKSDLGEACFKTRQEVAEVRITSSFICDKRVRRNSKCDFRRRSVITNNDISYIQMTGLWLRDACISPSPTGNQR